MLTRKKTPKKLKFLNTLIFLTLIICSNCFQSSMKINQNIYLKAQEKRLLEIIQLEKNQKENSNSSQYQLLNNQKSDDKEIDDGTCIQPDFLNQENFEYMMSKFKDYEPKKILERLPKYLSEAGKEMLSPQQTIEFVTTLNFGDRLEEILAAIKDNVWLTSKSLKDLLIKVKELKNRGKILKKLFPVITDHIQAQFEFIEDSLDCDQKKILEEMKLHYKPRDCFFGDLSGDTVFVIDLSGSMLFQMKYMGRYLYRLSFVKQLFERAIKSLTPDQKFQIVTFSTKAHYPFGDNKTMYNASLKNKKHFIEKINSLKVGRGANKYTNLSEALTFAYDMRANYKRIIFFSDGGPTRGITFAPYLRKHIQKLRRDRKANGLNDVPVNFSMLLLGGAESAWFRKNAKIFAKLIAKESNGIVKNYDSK